MQMHEIDTGSFTAHITVQFQNRNEHRNPWGEMKTEIGLHSSP